MKPKKNIKNWHVDGWEYIKFEGEVYIRVHDVAEGLTEVIKTLVPKENK